MIRANCTLDNNRILDILKFRLSDLIEISVEVSSFLATASPKWLRRQRARLFASWKSFCKIWFSSYHCYQMHRLQFEKSYYVAMRACVLAEQELRDALKGHNKITRKLAHNRVCNDSDSVSHSSNRFKRKDVLHFVKLAFTVYS